jgi:phage repressor protein C with HTH and peptisase S24 domain
MRLVDRHEVSADWLFSGHGQMDKTQVEVSEETNPRIRQNLPDDFEPKTVTYVPVYGAPLGAGQAGNAAMQNVRGYMAWEKRWLRREARIDPARAFVAQVYGQSMEDLIENGDLVLGETREMVDHDGIYAVRLDNELFVKHVMRRSESIVLVSENEVYSDIELSKHDDFAVIGRVIARVGAV